MYYFPGNSEPSVITKVWTPLFIAGGFTVTAPTAWEPITDGLLLLPGWANGGIQGAFSLSCVGINGVSDNFNARVVLETSAGDLILPELGGDSYSDAFLGSTTLQFWAGAPLGVVTYTGLRAELFCGGNGGNLATVWQAQLTASEVTFT